MRNSLVSCAVLIVFLAGMPGMAHGQFPGNPGTNIGKKNLVVSAEYSQLIHDYELDTRELPTTNERVRLKVTAGLADWLDVYIEGGGAGLLLDYRENDSYATKNFDSDFEAGVGLGARVRLMHFADSQTSVFLQGGGFYFKTDETIEWDYFDRTMIKNRDMKWADFYCGLGVVKRIEFMDLSAGIGYSQIQWWMKDNIEVREGNAISWDSKPWRDSYESNNPVFGFLGVDFILPYEYRVSVQTNLTNVDNYGFAIAISQGLQRK